MTHIALARPPHDDSVELIDRMAAVIRELSILIREENAALAAGMPVGLAQTAQRKQDLSDEYEEMCAEMAEIGSSALGTDAVKLHALAQATQALRCAAAENLTRLEAALSASRKRIEAIMDAVRDQHAQNATYGAGGGIPLGARLAAFGKDFHA